MDLTLFALRGSRVGERRKTLILHQSPGLEICSLLLKSPKILGDHIFLCILIKASNFPIILLLFFRKRVKRPVFKNKRIAVSQWLFRPKLISGLSRNRRLDSCSVISCVRWFSTLSCSERFFAGYSGFPFSKKETFDFICFNSIHSLISSGIRTINRRPRLTTLQCSLSCRT